MVDQKKGLPVLVELFSNIYETTDCTFVVLQSYDIVLIVALCRQPANRMWSYSVSGGGLPLLLEFFFIILLLILIIRQNYRVNGRIYL